MLGAYVKLLRGNRNLRRLWWAQLVSELGDWFYSLAVYNLLLELTGNRAQSVGLAVVLQVLPLTFASPTAGVVNDRVSRRRIMIGADVARFFIVLGMLLVRTPGMVWLVYPLLLLETIGVSFFEPAHSAVIPNIVEAGEVHTANALSSITWCFCLAVGASLGGVVAVVAGRDAVFVLNALSFLGSAWFIRGMRFAEPHTEGLAPFHARELADFTPMVEGLRYIRADRRLLATLFVKCGGGILGANLVLLPILGTRAFRVRLGGIDASRGAMLGMSLLMGARGVGALMGPLFGNRWAGSHEGRMRAGILAGFLCAAAGYVLLGFAQSLALAVCCVALAHAGGSANWVFSTTLLQLYTEDRFRGRVFAAELGLLMLMISAAGYVAGTAIDWGVAPRTFAMGMGLALLAPAGLWARFARFARNAPRASGGEAEDEAGSGGGGGALLDGAFELAGEDADDLQAERFRSALHETGRAADAVVLDGELEDAGLRILEGDADFAGAPAGKGVLESVGHQLIEDEGAGNGAMDAHLDGRDIEAEGDAVRLGHLGGIELLHELPGIFLEVDAVEVFGAVEMLVDEGDGKHAAAALLESGRGFDGAGGTGLHTQQAGDDGQVVLHTVVDLFEEHGLLTEGRFQVQDALAERLLGGFAFGDVMSADQHLAGAADVQRGGGDQKASALDAVGRPQGQPGFEVLVPGSILQAVQRRRSDGASGAGRPVAAAFGIRQRIEAADGVADRLSFGFRTGGEAVGHSIDFAHAKLVVQDHESDRSAGIDGRQFGIGGAQLLFGAFIAGDFHGGHEHADVAIGGGQRHIREIEVAIFRGFAGGGPERDAGFGGVVDGLRLSDGSEEGQDHGSGFGPDIGHGAAQHGLAGVQGGVGGVHRFEDEIGTAQQGEAGGGMLNDELQGALALLPFEGQAGLNGLQTLALADIARGLDDAEPPVVGAVGRHTAFHDDLPPVAAGVDQLTLPITGVFDGGFAVFGGGGEDRGQQIVTDAAQRPGSGVAVHSLGSPIPEGNPPAMQLPDEHGFVGLFEESRQLAGGAVGLSCPSDLLEQKADDQAGKQKSGETLPALRIGDAERPDGLVGKEHRFQHAQHTGQQAGTQSTIGGGEHHERRIGDGGQGCGGVKGQASKLGRGGEETGGGIAEGG